MSEYIIKGGKKVSGEVIISGSKNASLPIIAATILNAGKTTLYNVPNIHDTKMMFEIGWEIQKCYFFISRGLRYLIDTSDKFKINEWIREFIK